MTITGTRDDSSEEEYFISDTCKRNDPRGDMVHGGENISKTLVKGQRKGGIMMTPGRSCWLPGEQRRVDTEQTEF